MKKSIYFVIVMFFSMSATMAFAGNKDLISNAEKSAVPVKTENKLSEKEIVQLTKRVEEIRKMDKTDMNAKEKKELRKELKEIKKNLRNNGGIYIGSGALIVIIILLIILI